MGSSPLRVLVVASFDSFLRAGNACAEIIAKTRGAEIDHRVVAARPGQLSEAQFRALGFERPLPTETMGRLVTRETLERYDLILCALDGLRSRRFMSRFRGLWAGTPRRPLVLSLYPGLVFRFHLEGMASRASSDLLLLNSPADRDLYASLMDCLGMPQNGVTAGLTFLPPRSALRPDPPTAGDVVFVGQPTVPGGRAERRYVVAQMIGLAKTFPETSFVIKPRHRRGETTLHRMRHHYEDLLEESGPIPANLKTAYEPMEKVLGRARLCLTFSSTAAIEAVVRGIPTRILTDLGVHENLGNHFFLGSGLFADFADVRPDLPYRQNSAWLEKHVASAADHAAELCARIDELIERQRVLGQALPIGGGDRLFGRAPAFTEYVERELGWELLERFGDSSAKLARLWRVMRPLRRAARGLRRRPERTGPA